MNRYHQPPATSSPHDRFDEALDLHRAGDLDAAALRYEAILSDEPARAEVLAMLGALHLQRDQYEAAERVLHAALRLRPDRASILANHGLALHHLGWYKEALARFDRALAIKPDFVEALNNRGIALAALGRSAQALMDFDAALSLASDHVGALHNRGRMLGTLKRYPEALASLDRVIALEPDNTRVLRERGMALAALGRFEEANSCFSDSLRAMPDDTEALIHCALAQAALKHFKAALEKLDRVLVLDPTNTAAMNHRGQVLCDLNRPGEALSAFDASLAAKPNVPEVLKSRGVALMALDRMAEAVATLGRALALKPDDVHALKNRAQALRRLKRYSEARKDLEALLRIDPKQPYAAGDALLCQVHGCDWRDLDERVEQAVDATQRGEPAVHSFILLGLTGEAAVHQAAARMYAKALRNHDLKKQLAPGFLPDPGRRLRVAYLSADFHRHATAELVTRLFELHDRTQMEVIGVSFGPEDGSPQRKRLKQAFDEFLDVSSLTDDQIAEKLRAMQVSIAIDLKGYTADSRIGIFARRVAPLQVSYLGYPGTLGAEFMDYLIADHTVVPPENEHFHDEKIVRLPDTYQPNDALRPIAARTPTRTEVGLPPKAFVFCCFNNNYKILPPMFDVWMRILHRVEGSVLWLLADNQQAARNLRREAEKRGVQGHRLVFARRISTAEHLARHRLADLSLDTLPYNAHTTASDALWAGLPLLTCMGHAFAGRVAASLLRAAAMPELVTENFADYEEKAVQLATRRNELAALRQRLQDSRRTAPLFDSERYTRHMEDAYRMMWKRYCEGEAPASFDVPPRPPANSSGQTS